MVCDYECLPYFRCEDILTTNMSIQPSCMDILFDRTIVLLHYISLLFDSLGLWGLVLALIGSKGFRFSITLQCPFNIILASSETIVYCRHHFRVLEEWLLVQIRHLYMMKTLCSPNLLRATSFDSRCQHSTQVVVRVVVKGLLSEGFCQSDSGQRAADRAFVRVADVGVKVSD
jgi:hypothetical protein